MAVAGKPACGASRWLLTTRCPPLSWLGVVRGRVGSSQQQFGLRHVAFAPLPLLAALADQKFVVLGAGSAGLGVVSMIAQGEPPPFLSGVHEAEACMMCGCCPVMFGVEGWKRRPTRRLGLWLAAEPQGHPRYPTPPYHPPGMVKHGLSPEEAASRFYVLDARGLITRQVRRRRHRTQRCSCTIIGVSFEGSHQWVRMFRTVCFSSQLFPFPPQRLGLEAHVKPFARRDESPGAACVCVAVVVCLGGKGGEEARLEAALFDLFLEVGSLLQVDLGPLLCCRGRAVPGRRAASEAHGTDRPGRRGAPVHARSTQARRGSGWKEEHRAEGRARRQAAAA